MSEIIPPTPVSKINKDEGPANRRISLTDPAPQPSVDLTDEAISSVLKSDYSLDALSKRLKQSTETCEEFARYLSRKANSKSDNYTHLKKLSRSTNETMKKNTSNKLIKDDSFVKQFSAILSIEEKLLGFGNSYVQSVIRISDDLNYLKESIKERRKSIKDEARKREQECLEAIQLAEKAKIKYNSLCKNLEKVRTTSPNRTKFTIKGAKTTLQQEEELSSKISTAETDYRSKSEASQSIKKKLVEVYRPNYSAQLRDLILEIDISLSLKLQEYTNFEESLLMHLAVTISPASIDSKKPSIKNIASSVNVEKDLYDYLMGFHRKTPKKEYIPIQYKLHPSFQNSQANYNANFNLSINSGLSFSTTGGNNFGTASNEGLTSTSTITPDFTQSVVSTSYIPTRTNRGFSSLGLSVAPLPGIIIPPVKLKTFGNDIDTLIRFQGEENFVPYIVKYCISLIDLYGLDTEGIYRTSGNQLKLQELKESIDSNPNNIIQIIPSNNSASDGEIYLIASLLKAYFISLPEPLLSNELYPEFIAAARLPAESRVKKLHQTVYALPDGPYWTLRSLLFHFRRVSQRQDINRMSASNLGIIWGPTLLSFAITNPDEKSYQSKVIEYLMLAADEIFEAE
ncbi:GTPase-activating protein RGD1 [Ascoidea rubescens DSM 1968]|uniref:RhoGAP-domain-containing protein n=1 Tax=Ascoidea rubescens DSM 1968 TaxID=1344418 RepID=A0A1D2VG53_9ASCO|nr:RhoGAP-domain-containing protein [Ascoidea rubescens DSM 1968]ODV60658.1 RhoGAP-domain-containing protein [Ascoidea rubescens DSM 1968]